MNARASMILVALMAAAVLATGCGDDGDAETATAGNGDATVTTSSLSKGEFVKQADAICQKGRSEVIRAEGSSFAEAITVTMVPAFEGIIEEVQELGAPQGDEAEIEAFLSAMQADTAALEEGRQSVASIEEVEPYFKESGALAHKYGIPKCAFYTDFGTPGT